MLDIPQKLHKRFHDGKLRNFVIKPISSRVDNLRDWRNWCLTTVADMDRDLEQDSRGSILCYLDITDKGSSSQPK